MSNRDGDLIAAKFLQHRVSGTGNTRQLDGSMGARLTTDGKTIFSYEWWPVAYWIDDATIAVTDTYYTYEKERRGKRAGEFYDFVAPTSRHHVDSARNAVTRAGFVDTGETVAFYADKHGGERIFRLYSNGVRLQSEERGNPIPQWADTNTMPYRIGPVSFPATNTVNGLSIRGWMLPDVPCVFCSPMCAAFGGYRGHAYEAFPLYAISADGSEVCDTCLTPLDDFAYQEWREREDFYRRARENVGGYEYNVLETL